MEKTEKNKKLSGELIRFVITGIICSLLDFLVSYGVTVILKAGSLNDTLIVAISTLAGFTIGVIANYLLSTFWVFKNVREGTKSKSPLFIFLFVILSIGGWLVSFGTMELCRVIIQHTNGININEVEISFKAITTAGFWLFGVSFVLKTLVGMVWNYLTRKFILYKAPKKEDKKAEEENISDQ